MFMLQECRRLLQRGDQILLDAPDLSHDDARDVDVLCFGAAASSSSAAQPAPSGAAEPAAAPSSSRSPTRGSVGQPLVPEPGTDEEALACESEAEVVGDEEPAPAQPAELPGGPSPFIKTSVREVGDGPEDDTNTMDITTLTNTTSVYDDP